MSERMREREREKKREGERKKEKKVESKEVRKGKREDNKQQTTNNNMPSLKPQETIQSFHRRVEQFSDVIRKALAVAGSLVETDGS